MARSYSSTVFTLSSARGLGCSSSCVCALMRNLRGQFLPAAICAAIAFARAWLVDRAQRFGQAVVAGSERGGIEVRDRARAAACRAFARRGRAGRRRAPARRRPGRTGERGADAGDGAFDVAAIDDVRRSARVRDRPVDRRAPKRRRAPRGPPAASSRRRAAFRRREIRSRPCHAACASCGRPRAPVHGYVGRSFLLPWRCAESRACRRSCGAAAPDSITMSCDSALHMS